MIYIGCRLPGPMAEDTAQIVGDQKPRQQLRLFRRHRFPLEDRGDEFPGGSVGKSYEVGWRAVHGRLSLRPERYRVPVLQRVAGLLAGARAFPVADRYR